jgi:2-keto-4-pentenoate hydratase/2-oxohepta-3-ene-1,7-dioic acid hydratase in catechol pathway
MGFKPAVYLRDGDRIELGIEKLGQQRQNVTAYVPA